jgi:hypothetical protein
MYDERDGQPLTRTYDMSMQGLQGIEAISFRLCRRTATKESKRRQLTDRSVNEGVAEVGACNTTP